MYFLRRVVIAQAQACGSASMEESSPPPSGLSVKLASFTFSFFVREAYMWAIHGLI